MTPQAMVFDIGEVLVGWSPERLYARLIPDADARARFFREVCPPEWNDAFDRGRSMPQGVAEDAAANPEYAALIRAWWEMWPEMIGPPIEGSVACLRALKRKGTPVYGLTNFAAETFAIAQRMFPFLTEFDHVVVSAHVKANKPEPAIYAALEAAIPHPPQALFFADDKPANVAGARARGWRAHLFETPEGLQAELVACGMLEPAEIAAAG
jgi:2-haloacid dehalogenase